MSKWRKEGKKQDIPAIAVEVQFPKTVCDCKGKGKGVEEKHVHSSEEKAE